MPDIDWTWGFRDIKNPVSPVDPEVAREYKAFIDWFAKTYGMWTPAPSIQNFKTSRQYQAWKGDTPPATAPTAPVTPSQTTIGDVPQWPDDIRSQPFSIQEQPGTSRIINNYQGTGYDVSVQYDVNGNPVITDVLGKTAKPDSDEMTPYQKAQLDLSERKWQAEDFATRQQQAIEAERNRMAKLSNMNTDYLKYASQAARQQERGDMAQNYEAWRSRLLGELTDSRDWITKWQVQNNPNPYKPSGQTLNPEEGIQNWLTNAEQEVANAGAAFKAIATRVTDAGPGTPEPAELGQAYDRFVKAANERNNAEAAMKDYAGTSPSGLSADPRGTPFVYSDPKTFETKVEYMQEDESESQRPSGPPIPRWLPSFVPQLAGKSVLSPSEKYQVAAPSGQMWQATPTSVKQGVAGYMDWAGQDYRDTLDYMKMMLPNNPTRVASGWNPRR